MEFTTLTLEEYKKECRDVDKFIGFCRECKNYGKSWACPPFEYDIDEMMNYKWATLIANKIIPEECGMPLAKAAAVMRPERMRMEQLLLRLEKELDGRAFAFAGTCLYCPEGTCTRLQGEACRHPELVRPSLEAVGFDVSKSAEMCGMKILWSKGDVLPEYLTLVTGFFHNAEPGLVEQSLREYKR